MDLSDDLRSMPRLGEDNATERFPIISLAGNRPLGQPSTQNIDSITLTLANNAANHSAIGQESSFQEETNGPLQKLQRISHTYSDNDDFAASDVVAGTLRRGEDIPEATKETMRSMAIDQNWGYVKIARELSFPDGRHIPASRVKAFLQTENLATKERRDFAALGLAAQTLPPGEDIPAETKEIMSSMAIDQKWGYVKIARELRLPDGRQLPRSRVQAFLNTENLATKEHRDFAALGLAAETLRRDEDIPEETKETMRSMAIDEKWGYTKIARELRLPDGRQVPASRVESFLRVENLATKEHRDFAALGLAAETLRRDEDIPAETEETMRSMSIDQKWGYRKIARELRLPDGRQLPASRVERFLRAENLTTKKHRDFAALGLAAGALRRDEDIAQETKETMRSMAIDQKWGYVKIARELLLPDGRQVPASRVQSFLRRLPKK